MVYMRNKFAFCIIAILAFQTVHAQTCCSGGVPLSNNLGMPNEGRKTLQIAFNYDYNNLNTLNAGSDRLNDDSRKRITNSLLLGLGYAITDRFSVESLWTWVNQTRTINQFNNENITETTGIGDAVFLVKYAIPEILGQRTIWNLGIGLKAPLGASDISSEQGFLLTADLQPGSGAWDGIGWLSISKGLSFRPSATIAASLTYRLTGENNKYLNNTATYEFGDEVLANAGYTDQFLVFNTVVNPGLILKYRKAWQDKIDGSDIPNTGGEWLFLRPELQIQLAPNIAVATRVELPVYSYVDGTQLTPTVRFTAGMLFKINANKTNTLISKL